MRYKIRNKIKSRYAKIQKLEQEILELKREDALFSDRNQWYVEQEEEVVLSRRPKKTEIQLIGRVYWKEEFYEYDSNDNIVDTIVVTRKKIVKRKKSFF